MGVGHDVVEYGTLIVWILDAGMLLVAICLLVMGRSCLVYTSRYGILGDAVLTINKHGSIHMKIRESAEWTDFSYVAMTQS